jgi:hypothetical protein
LLDLVGGGRVGGREGGREVFHHLVQVGIKDLNAIDRVLDGLLVETHAVLDQLEGG